ncbi:diguanylate cyclase (GGDEF) domain-containing protein [Dethiosulfatibacter aminovorans DSM 17477]|uniref:Diguanylate cyclase (GGDEF) domain-containing protein n=1 Tax=Dethiosulfatibacter aminovorans DSM 17477 TaxID=1121476 RepID=A0A1M6LNL2_9FIRM|nr:GGDEF domain-containing protein [Dethiosulfatibacter aminovorans]SHJ72784.1 diguanylate cyclase (GGDEF) domain-containing protein [Dethiosulfatibacter aminovorans DSM 17477]
MLCYTMGKEQFKRGLFMDIMDNGDINTVFQPIISLRDGSVFGYEALSRGPEKTCMENPGSLFEYAEKNEYLWELELLCRSKAIEAAKSIGKEHKLFLNVNPNIINDSKFKKGFTRKYLHSHSMNPERIIFEITEREAVLDSADFMTTVRNYKDQDFQIAIDDAGAGFSGLKMISDVKPHYIKLDMDLIRNIDKDVTKQSLVKSMSEYATLSNTKLIAEGIETREELEKLISIGIHYGQGYFIQKPLPEIRDIRHEVTNLIRLINSRKNHLITKSITRINICHLTEYPKTLSPNIKVKDVYQMLEDDDSIPGFCVTENGRPVGVLTKNHFYRSVSGHHGYSLFSNKPISTIMQKDFISVEYNTSIATVSKKAMQRDKDSIYDFITVVRDGYYSGIVTVKDLLLQSIEIEVSNAKHLNPLSELPGNVLIEKQLEKCISMRTDDYILYYDIDNFKAYNDVYGFENGDRVIKHLSTLLKDSLAKEAFIGHIGGDDFISIQRPENIEKICNTIVDRFNSSIKEFYNQDDLDKGFIITKNRHGIEESFPLLTITVTGLSSNCFKSIYELAEKAGKLKKECKQNPGINYILQ